MKKSTILLIAATILFFGCTKNDNKNTHNEPEPLTRIAFGSCCAQYLTNMKIFDRILELNPQLYIAGGDNIYGDFFASIPVTPDIAFLYCVCKNTGITRTIAPEQPNVPIDNSLRISFVYP